MNNKTESRQIPVDDGTQMGVFIARPRSEGPYPGMIVFQEAFGVNAHIRDITGRIAAEGFVAVAPELFHRTAGGFEGSYTDFASAAPHITALSRQTLESDIRATHRFLSRESGIPGDRIYSTGFCLGGRVSFLASTLVPLRAAASFYGSGIDGLLDESARVNCPLLFCWGGKDSHIPEEKIRSVLRALDGQEKEYISAVFSRAEHGFFCDARASFHPRSAAMAWELLKSFWTANP